MAITPQTVLNAFSAVTDAIASIFAPTLEKVQTLRKRGFEAESRKMLNAMKNSNVDVILPSMAPVAAIPAFAIVALRSNIETYGPWSSIGPTGKVRFEQDDSLVPWNYNGYPLLNDAAYAKINDGVTNMQVGEEGDVTLPGSPTKNLGDVLSAGGPNITSITVDFGPDGVRTTYNMRTYTHQLGRQSKQLGDKIARMGIMSRQLQRQFNLKRALNKTPVALNNGSRGLRFVQRRDTGIAVLRGKSPHSFFTSFTFTDSSGVVRHLLGTSNTKEAIASTNANDDVRYKQTALMSMDGLFTPYSVSTAHTGMPHFSVPTSGVSGPTVVDLNPWGSGTRALTDVAFALWGDTYPDITGADLPLRPPTAGFDYTKVRAIGLRGPMILSSWGYDTHGQPVPTGSNGEFAPDFRFRSDLWPTGPIDLRWDNDRKVWKGGDHIELYTIIAHSGRTVGGRPQYAIKNVTDIVNSGTFVLGNTVKAAFNLQEGQNDIHTVGVNSPVIVYELFDSVFFSELPRSFARIDEY